MADQLPFVMIPGLNCSARLYQHQAAAFKNLGPVIIADHTQDESISAMTARILSSAPEKFHVIGLSMGGYIAFEMLRIAQERIGKMALLDTSARADLPEHTERRKKLIALSQSGKFSEVNDMLWPVLVHENRRADSALRQIIDDMAADTGPEVFVRQQKALITRADARPVLPTVTRPVLVMVGEGDRLTPLPLAQEIAEGIPGASLEVVAGAGHLSPLEKPEAVTASLLRFFAG